MQGFVDCGFFFFPFSPREPYFSSMFSYYDQSDVYILFYLLPQQFCQDYWSVLYKYFSSIFIADVYTK